LMLYGTHVLALEPAAGCTRTSIFFFFKFRIHIRLMGCTTRPSDSANTMSSALEVLGLSLPYSSSTPATYDGTCI
jgi:Dehydratase family